MKKLFLLLVFISAIQLAFGQVDTKYFPGGDAFDQVSYINSNQKALINRQLPPFDATKLLDEDKLKENQDAPFRFGKGFDTEISLEDGIWLDIGEGRLWSMGFQSEGAFSINFIFDNFSLSEKSELYIINSSGTILYGPVTSKQNSKNGHFMTDVIQGQDVTIYLFEPYSEKGESLLTIKRVIHGYRNLFSTMADPKSVLDASLSCNINIACYSAWDQESDAVALVLLSTGDELCSGSLLMTANQSFDPYFLTAFHCIDQYYPFGSLSSSEITDAENWMFKFQYKVSTCYGSTLISSVTYNGADYKAAWESTDFALMKMNDSPIDDPIRNSWFSWLGWDKSGNIPTSGTLIHHPKGDVMKITFDNNSLTSNTSIIYWPSGTISPVNSHWTGTIDVGAIEKGSSGAPLLDQNKRTIGQIHGASTGCAPKTAYYGKFSGSWIGGGTDDTRLSNWLDPYNSGVITTNTTRSPYISGATLVCASGSAFTVNNLPSGSTIEWNSGYFLSRVSSQGSNPCTFSSSGIGSTWISATINLAGGGTITLPHFNVWSGVPALTSVSGPSPSYDDYGCTGYSYSFWTDPSRNALSQSSYEWAVEPSYFSWYFQSQYNDWATVVFNDPNEYYQVRVRASNTCGTSSWRSKMVSITDCYKFLLYPNPASGEVTISLTVAESVKKEEVPSKILVRITDNSGITYYSGTKGGDSFTIPVSNLKDGNYIVSIIYDGKIENLPLIIKN